jgi:hypothetical protein
MESVHTSRLITDTAHPAREGAVLAAIAPARSAGVTGLCRDRVALHTAVEIGEHTITTAIEYCATIARSA